jgi:hypothetical protein
VWQLTKPLHVHVERLIGLNDVGSGSLQNLYILRLSVWLNSKILTLVVR